MKTTKSNIIGIVSALMISLASCTETMDVAEHETQIANVMQADQLVIDSLNSRYINTMLAIDKNLTAIRVEQGILIQSSRGSDAGMDRKEKILAGIRALDEKLAENKMKLTQLEKQLKKIKKGNAELQLTLNLAKERILEEEATIAEMREEIEQKGMQLALANHELKAKTAENDELARRNEQMHKFINTVYVVGGTFKQLKKDNIVERKGDILGVGGVEVVKTNVDKTKFTELNKEENTFLSFRGTHAKLISSHPANSYTITNNNNVAEIVIKDPDTFWSSSKYLVVQVN